MTLTPARPVPDASSAEQQRLEVELLLREPVLDTEQLALADRSLLEGAGPLTLSRARSLTCLPLSHQNGLLAVAVPTYWGPAERQALVDELAAAGLQAALQLALADDINAGLEAPVMAPTPAPASDPPRAVQPARSIAHPR